MDVSCALFFCLLFVFFFFKQKTAYEMRISDWSSDVCSSDLPGVGLPALQRIVRGAPGVGGAVEPAAGGVLPLGLGRQATARPFRIGLRILWRNLHHGMRLSPFDGTLLPFRVAPVGTGDEMPPLHRSEERREGKECVSTCRSRR